MQSIKSFFTIVLLLLSTILIASEDHHDHDHDHGFEQHAAHVHGQATANISYENNILNIAFSFPAIDIYGFEHAAKTNEEVQAIDNALSLFRDSSNILVMTPECEHESHDHDHSTSHDDEDGHHEHEELEHSDVEVSYEFKCDTKSPIKIKFVLFNSFTSLEEINVQFISDNMQQLFNVTSNNQTITIN
ncbi:MAG: DUF2796 domain-containing protein [Pseudomonadota bacterium]